MHLKYVKLNNIRSYTAQQINFPDGSVLLSGDIGAGKSTILLAIEFALFGVIRGSVDGAALLRHGKNNGSVELCFGLDGREIIINRTLRRNKTSVAQTAGYIAIDGIKTDCTAVELKAKVLELLGYPKSLLTKSKALIYRYTVYTPQEEMKHILFEDSAARVDTLRKVFQIDAYKRIRDNAAIASRFIRERETELRAKIEDLPLKRSQRDELKKQQKDVHAEFEQLTPLLKDAKDKLVKHQEQIKTLETQLQAATRLKTQLAAKEAALQEKQNQIESLKQQQQDAERQLRTLQSTEIDTGAFALHLAHLHHAVDVLRSEATSREQLSKELLNIEKELSIIAEEMGKAAALQQTSRQLEQSVLSNDICPVCKQKITDAHKSQVKSQVAALLTESQQLISRKTSARQQLLQQQALFKDKLDALTEKERRLAELSAQFIQYSKEAEQLNITPAEVTGTVEVTASLASLQSLAQQIRVAEANKKVLVEKTAAKQQLAGRLQSLQQESFQLQQQISSQRTQLATYTIFEDEYKLVRQRCDELQQREKELLVKQAALDSNFKSLQTNIRMLDEEIKLKETASDRLSSVSQMHNWLNELFVNLMETVEKHVMLRVYRQFNELFQNWFNVLMGDETVSGRLDESFAPIVEINGYETPLENLSGGEKTSCALAYRLALNKVINDIISTIQTRDIIILDEPTDGFSSEQLDKVRDLLEQLGLPQVILVSHESKVESFVENVIRVAKEQHVSHVLQP